MTIEEQRRRRIAERIQQMAGDDAPPITPEAYIHSKSRRQGRLRLQQALAAQGVDEAISRSLMPRREDELRTAVAILRKKFRQSAADLKEKQKQARFLTYRGFDADTVQTALKTAWDENNGYGEDSF